MPTLYELTGSFTQVQQLIEEGADLTDTLESIEMVIEDKLEGYGKVIRNLEGDIASYKAEEKRLADRRKTIENGLKRIKDSAYENLKNTGKKSVDAGTFKFSIAKNPAAVKVLDESLIPIDFFVTPEPSLDNKALKDALKNGVEVTGAALVQGESLQIK